MARILVRMLYTPKDPPGLNSAYDHLISKLFVFERIPVCNCKIILKDDAITWIDFLNPWFDPETGIYTVDMRTSEGVERYYQGDVTELMNNVMARYKKYKWSCKKLD